MSATYVVLNGHRAIVLITTDESKAVECGWSRPGQGMARYIEMWENETPVKAWNSDDGSLGRRKS